jgi:High potential iron-sulfur protein
MNNSNVKHFWFICSKVLLSCGRRNSLSRVPREGNVPEYRSRRREALKIIAWGGAMAGSGTAVAQSCLDLAKLPNASLRRSLNFQSNSADPKKQCGGCTFFTRMSQGECGKCAIFSGGPVSSKSVCDSWTATPQR